MMLKFRAWHKIEKRWIEIFLINPIEQMILDVKYSYYPETEEKVA